MKRRTSHPDLIWQEIFFANAISQATAATALEHICAHRGLGCVVIELRATSKGVRWLLATGSLKEQALRELLKAHIEGVRITHPRRIRRPADTAGSLRFNGLLPTTQPDRIAASVRGLYGALTRLEEHEELTLQLIIGPRLLPAARSSANAPSWADLLLQAATGDSPKESAARLAQGSNKRESDLHGARVELRVGIAGASAARSRYLGNQMLGALRVLESAGTRTTVQSVDPQRLNDARPPWRWSMNLRSTDLVAVSGWPVGEPPLPLLGSLHPRLLAPARCLIATERTFATTAAPGHNDPVGIPIQDAAMHTHLLGPTGSGKSTVLLHLILADIEAGRGVLVIDPKGDLASDVLARIPEKRHKDVVVLDPTSSQPVGLNPLAGPERSAHITADTLLSTFHAIFHEHWGIRTADVLGASLLTLGRIPEANLLWLSPLLTNPAFRREVLKRSHDPLGVDSFWQQYNAKKPEQQAQEIAPVLNKLRQLILRPTLRSVLGQSEPKFNLDELFTKRRIVIVSLNKGVLGADAARLLGSLLVDQLWARILARQRLPVTRRHIVGIYIDEVHDFINGIPGDLSDALAQARSLGAAFTLTNQYLSQLSSQMQSAIDSNTRSKIVFGLGGVDATTVARKAQGLEAADFQLLPKYHAYVDLMQNGRKTGWFTVATPKPCPQKQPAADLYAASHERYGVSAKDTEQELIDLISPSTSSPSTPTDAAAPIGRIRTNSKPTRGAPAERTADTTGGESP